MTMITTEWGVSATTDTPVEISRQEMFELALRQRDAQLEKAFAKDIEAWLANREAAISIHPASQVPARERRGLRLMKQRWKAGVSERTSWHVPDGYVSIAEQRTMRELDAWCDAYEECCPDDDPCYEHGEPWMDVDYSSGFSSEIELPWLDDWDWSGNTICNDDGFIAFDEAAPLTYNPFASLRKD